MRYALMESKQLLNFAVSKVLLPTSKLKCSSVKYVRKFCISVKTNDKSSSNKQRQKHSSEIVPGVAKRGKHFISYQVLSTFLLIFYSFSSRLLIDIITL